MRRTRNRDGEIRYFPAGNRTLVVRLLGSLYSLKYLSCLCRQPEPKTARSNSLVTRESAHGGTTENMSEEDLGCYYVIARVATAVNASSILYAVVSQHVNACTLAEPLII
jgi:hypothetical protein